MKRKFTLLIAALALLTMIVQPGRVWGQTKGEITWTASAQGYTNQQEITSVTFDSSVSGSFNKGTNSYPPKYYTTGTAIRCYGGNYFTISSSNTLTAITISFGNNDGSNAITTDVGTYSNGSWTGSANSVKFTIGGSSGNRRIAGFNITYSSGGTPTIATPTITPNGGNFITSQEVSISCTTEDVTIYYTLDGNDPTTTSTQYANPFTITETTTVKAFAVKDGYNDSNIATAEFTKATAMTIAEVRAQQTGDVFTTGIVTSCVGTTGYIQDATAAICVYGASLTVGNEISVSGSLQDYNGLLEITSPQVTVVSSGNVVDPEVMTVAEVVESTNQGWYIRIENATVTAISGQNTTIAQGESTIVARGISGVTLAVNDIISLNGNIGCFNANQIANPQDVTVQQPTEPTITLSSYAINAPIGGANGTLTVTYENITDVAADVWFCDAAGENDATYDWVTAEINTDNNVYYLVEENNGEARTAYFKVYALDDDANDVYSNLVTINQDEYVAPTYATLPFEFDGGRANIAETDGLYEDGLGSDYGSSPKLKFDNTGDWLLLQFDERPGTLTFDIKNNSFSGGTFTVQTSEDGATYTDLENYTTITGTQNEEFDNLGENVRYIKWIYTNKSSGNVGLGNIGLTAYVAPVPSIEAEDVNIAYNATEGVITYTVTNPASDGNLTAEITDGNEGYWLTLGTIGANVPFTCTANTGAERTTTVTLTYTYNTTETVTATAVVTQAAYVVPTASIVVTPTEVNATAAETEGNLAITLENIVITEEGGGMFDLTFCDSEGEPLSDQTAPAAWFGFEFTFANNAWSLDYMISENTSTTPNETYFTVYGLGDDGNTEAYSNLVHVTQAGVIPTYLVSFNLDGGTFVANDDFTTDIVEKEAGTYTLPSATKENINFAGWLLDGTETIYAAGAQYQVTADVSFTAQWSNAVTATITFGSAQGSTNINNTSITGDDSAGNTWTITTEGTTSFTPNAGYARIGSSSKPATSITFTTTLSNDVTITAFSAKFGGFSGTAGTIFLKVGETTVGTGSLNATADVTINNTSTAFGNVLTVTVNNIAKGVKAYYISYSYELGTDPIIIAPSSVDLAYNATSGEIEYSIINPATGVSLDATTTESWISNFVITDDKVTFTTTENTDYIPRQGTITLSYQDADNVDVLVNQAAAPMPMDDFALFTGDLVEGDYIIYYDGKALNTTVTSNRLQYAEVTPENNVIATNDSDIIWHIAPSGEYWTIYNATADAYAASTGTKNQAQMMSDGTDDKALWTVTGTETYEFVNKYNSENSINAKLRNNGTYGFACYATGTGGALTLYKRTSAVASYDKVITGYGDNEGGYYLIASPVSVNPTNVEGMVELDNTTPSYPLYDLYRFDQTEDAEWYNYKAHQFYLTPGRGYLYAKKTDVTLTFNGMPYTGDGVINLTYDESTTLKGWNLIGNPYGSSANLNKPYYILNSDGSELRSETETEAINAMEGVFVQATEAGQTAQFTLVSNSKEQRSIAQAKIMVSGNNGKVIDNAIIRFDGGESLGKFQINNNHTRLYIPQDNTDYAIVNAEAEGQMPLNFKAETTGNYTISFKLNGANVGYLHLIDKATGEDINLFTNPEYSFVGSPRDAEDRFIICFSNNTKNDNFAYQNGSDIIVNGNGELQVFDVTGRMVMNTKINGIQTVNVPATGMYIFRMVGESVQTQKIVVR